jgi:ATP-dependent Zn protease
MGTESGVARLTPAAEASRELATQWRRLARTATAVAIVTSPVAFVWMHTQLGWGIGWSVLATFGLIAAYRGLVEVILRRLVPWPSLFGADDEELRAADVVDRRRAWTWRSIYRVAAWVAGIFFLFVTLVFFIRLAKHESPAYFGTAGDVWHALISGVQSQQFWLQMGLLPLLFFFNFAILFGPLMLMGVMQMQAFEPGTADWGVRLDDVRGQAEAKEEVRRVVSLWQSGEAFERAGGKRERGLLFLGQPGTGKTMLAKAIATGFNCPFVSMPGSGFAQSFMGMDAVIVRYLARKAKKQARKWGGQCIVFIDEIDAVGSRRSQLAGAESFVATEQSFHDHCFYGPNGALTPTGDLILETRAWREKVFARRAERPAPTVFQRIGGTLNQAFPGMMGGMGGGQLALNQLLVVMDGIDNPPFLKRTGIRLVNTFLDASWIVPERIGSVRLRLPAPRPRNEQIYFIGATNVPLDALDPALTRPGRMGRHVWLRTPTKQDRLDIFDLYLGKVDHEPELDTDKRRDELARVTNGYSPAMIEQVCSMALTYAHHDGRERFAWEDLVEATTTIESGMAINIDYIPSETRAVAIHEAGHAVAGHAYMKEAESTRLSIRRRGAALGHHQALQKEERFSSWRDEEMAQLIWALGAMAAERVFYGQNSTGVGGDVQSATARAAWMVGACAMGPEAYTGRLDDETAEQARERISSRFIAIGSQIMNRTGAGGPLGHDPIASVLSAREQRDMVAELLGQAYVAAHTLIEHNKRGVERVADALVERREIHGDAVLELLESANLQVPEVDLTKDEAWPKL